MVDEIKIQESVQDTSKVCALARRLAPEDILMGHYVMIHQDQQQFLIGRCSPLGEPEYVTMEFIMRPDETALPGKVVEVCLPYVVVENHKGKTSILDTRSKHLARVSESFGLAALIPHKPKEKDSECTCKKEEGSSKETKAKRSLLRKIFRKK
ncbi:MAG: hypothetical protein JKY43_00465 [Phycisphaerales bacterium]|nr:hypothetical protein [Phycisphaerales bacterium]